MKITFKVPQKWVEMAEGVGIPHDKMEEFFRYYITCISDEEEDGLSTFQLWLDVYSALTTPNNEQSG
jgi:hypothetical protein